MAPGEPEAERTSFGDVVLVARLRKAIWNLNPDIPEDGREEALRKVLRPETGSLLLNNRAFHRLLRDGVDVEFHRPGGTVAGAKARLIDFDHPTSRLAVVVLTLDHREEILGQTPVQAANRDHLKELLTVASGGVVFTTLQKFLPEPGQRMPTLSDRRWSVSRGGPDRAEETSTGLRSRGLGGGLPPRW